MSVFFNKNRIKNQSACSRKGGILFKLMLMLVAACLLTAILSAVLYYNFGIRVYGKRIADEMLPHARSIARVSERYIRGRVDYDTYRAIILDDQPLGARVFIYDDQGNLFAQTVRPGMRQMEPSEAYREFANRILAKGDELTESNLRQDRRMRLGVVVGVPIKDNLERVCGAVLLAKPSNELRDAMLSMLIALLMSSLIASVLLAVLAYFAGRRFTRPIRNMTDIAVSMASGDFSARADETILGEVGQLGSALNFLSLELSKSIGELITIKDRLTTILNGINDGVVSLDADGKTLFMNPAAVRLLQLQDMESFDYLMHQDNGEDIDDFAAMHKNVLRSGETTEIQIPMHDRILQCTATRTQITDVDSYGVIFVLRDITESERLEQTRRDYVANVSHELKTPVASIRSLAETLNDGMIHDEPGRNRYYGHILRESLRLSRLIDDLLELSRLQSGTVALTKSAFQLNEVLFEIAERTKINAEYSDIRFEYIVQELPLVYSNPDRIEQVLIALTDNAVKYTSDAGRIVLSAAAAEDCVVVEVRNSGHVSEGDLPHLFDRFYKVDKAHSGQGTGLGLAITKEVLHLLGETISVRNDGGDVVFSFTVKIH